MKRWQFLMLCIAIGVMLLGLRAHFNAKDSVVLKSDLNNLLTVLRENRVVGYRDQYFCRNLTTNGATYMAEVPSNAGDNCTPFQTKTVPFDQKGENVFRTVQRTIRATGLDLIIVSVSYKPDGTVEGANFAVNQRLGHSWYWYDQKDVSPDFPKAAITRLGGGWFYIDTN